MKKIVTKENYLLLFLSPAKMNFYWNLALEIAEGSGCLSNQSGPIMNIHSERRNVNMNFFSLEEAKASLGINPGARSISGHCLELYSPYKIIHYPRLTSAKGFYLVSLLFRNSLLFDFNRKYLRVCAYSLYPWKTWKKSIKILDR